MGQVYSLDGVVPVVDPTAHVHPSAVLIGDVIVGPGVYVGPCACLRGDFGRIELEEGSNIQDTCVLHTYPGVPTRVAVDGHVGHGAVLHGCTVGRDALIGMNAVIMDGATIGESAIVAACAFVRAGMAVPARTLVAGVPAKVLRAVSDQEIAWKREGTASYQDLVQRCHASLRRCDPLTEIEPDRPAVFDRDIRPLHEIKGD